MTFSLRNTVLIALTAAAISCGSEKNVAAAHHTGPDTTAALVPGASQVKVDSLFSPALGVEKHYTVYFPTSYDSEPTRRYPVAYFMHGSPGDEHDWVDKMRLKIILDSLAAHGSPQMIVVMPDGDDSFWHNWATHPPCGGGVDYCVQYMNYADYMIHDVVGHVDSVYRTEATAAHRGVAGLSMGGFGAVYLASVRPDVFSAAASLSGVEFSLLHVGTFPIVHQATSLSEVEVDTVENGRQRYGTSFAFWRGSDTYSLVNDAAAAHHGLASYWFVIGNGDLYERINANLIFDDLLTRLGIAHYFQLRPGSHTVEFWQNNAGDAAAWMAEKIGA